MNITPLRDQVLVKKIVVGGGIQQTTGGIFVPTSPHRDDRHEVVAIGPDVDLPLVPGDIVYIAPTVESHIVTIDRIPYKFVKSAFISGVEVPTDGEEGGDHDWGLSV
jgi:co-chaperonin GroES (HSP10)